MADYEEMLADLERDLAPIDRQRNELITTINVIRAKAGLPPRPGNGGGTGGTPAFDSESAASGGDGAGGLAKIRSDTFVGKRLRSASKEYLNMRRKQGLDGPATPRQIYDAIISGGFEFSAKDETTRLISLRNMLRKRTEVFKKFDNGKYGLMEWYDGIRRPRTSAPNDEADDETQETKTTPDLVVRRR